MSGTPSATPVAEPKLDRMSLRTTPLSASASGPLDPSPGYGPAVSSGMGSQLADDAPVVASVDVALAAVDVVPAERFDPQAASSAAPAPVAASVRSRRRSRSVA